MSDPVFDWKGVALGAIGGGVSAAVGGIPNFGEAGMAAKAVVELPGVLGSAVGTAIVSNVVTQGLAVAIGAQESFSWRGVAAAGVGAGVSDQLGGSLGKIGAGMVGSMAASLVRNKGFNAQSFATDVFGNAIGNSLAQSLRATANSQNTTEPTTPEQDNRALLNASNQAADPDYYAPPAILANDPNAPTSASFTPTQDLLASVHAFNAQTKLTQQGLTLPEMGGISPQEFGARRSEIEKQIRWEIAGEEARADSLIAPQMFMTGGGTNNLLGGSRNGIGSFQMVRNGNWDNALNIGADPFGWLGVLPQMQAGWAQDNFNAAKSQIDEMRQKMTDAGVKNMPDYQYNIDSNGTYIDIKRSGDRLVTHYEDHVRDQRLRETWGDDYQSARIGKSKMTVQEFEKKVLDVHMQATDRAYATTLDMIARGELKIKDGDYARTVGNEIDKRARFELRGLAKSEGINDSSMSNIWAINRRLTNDSLAYFGIPDGRIGYNIYHDTTLARKTGHTEQLQKWNSLREGNFVIMRPSTLGGPYVVPRNTISPYAPHVNLPKGKF